MVQLQKFVLFSFFIASLLFSKALLAEKHLDTVQVNSSIEAVTVFTKGAMVERTITLPSVRNRQILLLKDLPISCDPKSINVSASDNLEIISIKHSIENEVNQLDSLTYKFKQRALINDSILRNEKLLNVLSLEQNMIKGHNNYADSEGKTEIKSVIEAAAFYRTRMKEIELEKLDYEKTLSGLRYRHSILDNAINQWQGQRIKKNLHVHIQIGSTSIGKQSLTINYYVPNASWYSYYDIKVNKLSEALKLYRKAYVKQNTGEAWSEVKLTLSNANPKVNNTPPVLSPYKLDGPRVNQTQLSLGNYQNSGVAYGKVIDASGNPLIGANIIIQGTDQGMITDIDGSFIFPEATHRQVVFSYTGYNKVCVQLKPGINIIRLEEGQLLSEVVVTGSRSKLTNYYVDGVRVSKKDKVIERTSIKSAKLSAINSVKYVLEDRFTIMTDNVEEDVLIEKSDIACSYEYLAIPSLSEQAYLMAKIPNWHGLDLFKGKVNLFLANTFKGSSMINPAATEDTLSISLGVDPEVIVEREEIKDYYSKKFLNKNIEEALSYRLNIKNNKTEKIKLVVKDRVPISDHKDVKVAIEKDHGAALDQEKGYLVWDQEYQAGEKKNFSFAYKVKYPKNYSIEF